MGRLKNQENVFPNVKKSNKTLYILKVRELFIW